MQEASRVRIRRSSGKPMFSGVEGRGETWPALILASHNTASQQQERGRSFSTSKNGVLFAVDSRPELGHCEWIMRRNWSRWRMEYSKQFCSVSVVQLQGRSSHKQIAQNYRLGVVLTTLQNLSLSVQQFLDGLTVYDFRLSILFEEQARETWVRLPVGECFFFSVFRPRPYSYNARYPRSFQTTLHHGSGAEQTYDGIDRTIVIKLR
ncbi:hypothetical protein ASPVEDRAFT_336096 [Aspergillus versicolor CBS 583.65]|uniref:Uncharacterized protein n=1 Tax=Aspergillus versicolor CBS 583.65 TaxID=1036611 RepID=A0A1L9PZ96_ASPVE|nr:uncharacterized protein ASPVEDRAFT_336096 [Aspergillus versicolor CBS 583.65]OJJ06785.1 hypothetical protein ASPVEDRAFT_336096 [Aspergillus versicolor CBS 583.65]